MKSVAPPHAVITATSPKYTYRTTLTVHSVLEGPLAEEAWRLYLSAFGELAELAVQRHVMHHEEFYEVMADDKVDKYLSVGDDGKLQGLGTFTNDLTAVPLISPAYFRHRWPKLFVANKIWYVGFVATTRRQPAAFTDIIAAMFNRAAGGIVALDVCTHNQHVRNLPQAVEKLLARTVAPVPATQLDAQNYWLYDCTGDAVVTPSVPQHRLWTPNTPPPGRGGVFGMHLAAELHDCTKLINGETLTGWAADLVDRIEMEPYGEPLVGEFGFRAAHTPGWTLTRLLESSNLTAHEIRYVHGLAVDVFSCKVYDPEAVIEVCLEWFGGRVVRQTIFERG